jgi:hypothetical protein
MILDFRLSIGIYMLHNSDIQISLRQYLPLFVMEVWKGALKWFIFITLHHSTDISKSAIIQKHNGPIQISTRYTLLHYLNVSFLCRRITSIVFAHSFKLLVKASKYILNSDIWYALQCSAFLSVACLEEIHVTQDRTSGRLL